jgi:cation diffusion facilitator CzcD-associated flavoprotein CzcO
VIPAIAPDVEQLTVFQRTPIWCLPKLDAPLSARARTMLRWVPGAMLAARWLSQAFVELTFVLVAHFAGKFPFLPARGEAEALKLLGTVDDPRVREELTPHYRLGCKRPSFSNEYIRTFNRENVLLETSAIEEITPGGVRTADGVEHPVDVLVLATGFKVFEKGNMPPFPVRGPRGVELAEWWDENRQQAYEGVSVPGFPNWFSILGPYGFNGQSYFGLIETQMRHIVRCLDRARRERATRVEVREEANQRYFESVLARRGNQVFFAGSCANSNSYYFDAHGDVPFRPSLTLEAAWRSARFDLDDYAFAA